MREVDRKTAMTKPARTTNTMEICLRRFWEVKVDDDVHGLDVDTASKEVRANEVAADTFAELVEDAIAMRLEHPLRASRSRNSRGR